MIRKFLALFGPTLYVQIWADKLLVTDIKSGKIYDEPPIVAIHTDKRGFKTITGIGKGAKSLININNVVVKPFSHPRMLLSDFYVAVKLLQYAFATFQSVKWLRPYPKVVIHPMEKNEGGLSMIEKRAFRELAIGAGATKIVLYQGPQLAIGDVDFKTLDALQEAIVTNPSGRQSVGSRPLVWLCFVAIGLLAVWLFTT